MSSVLPNLKNTREKAHLTQRDLAKKIGCTVKTYRTWEKTDTAPDCYNLKLLAEELDVSTDYLLGRIEERHLDIHYVCEITGLSEAAVEKIITLRKKCDRFSAIMESSHFDSLVKLISAVCDEAEELRVETAVVNRYLLNSSVKLTAPYELNSYEESEIDTRLIAGFTDALINGPEAIHGRRWQAQSAVNALIGSLVPLDEIIQDAQKCRREQQINSVPEEIKPFMREFKEGNNGNNDEEDK